MYKRQVVTITLYGEQAQEGVNAAFQKAKDLEKILSSQNEKSELYQVNQSAYDHEVEVSDTLFTVTQRSLQYCKETDGALDCTIGKINDLWAFGTGDARLPGKEEITPLLVDRGCLLYTSYFYLCNIIVKIVNNGFVNTCFVSIFV